jgi:putative hydrolase of the HAD superfamily
VPDIKAIIFDIGGVLSASPVAGIRAWTEQCGIDYAVLGPLVARPESAFSRLERSDLTPEQFARQFQAECAAAGITADPLAFLASFADLPQREEMHAIVRHLHGRYKLGCITNNVLREEDAGARAEIFACFDVIVESARVGLRKPDPRIYLMTCEQLGVAPAEAVFLDDFGVNLKGARALGMTTIKVDETTRAIDELEAVLGIPLPRPASSEFRVAGS